MVSLSIKAGDCFTVGEDATVRFEGVRGGCARLKIDALDEVSVVRGTAPAPDGQELQEYLRELARGVASELSALDPSRGRELLGAFVSELVLSAADESRREERRQRQAEGIAAAKARGVRFGRQAAPLPEEFEECRRAWRAGQMSMRQAAAACGMSHSSFHSAAVRREQAESCAV